LKTKNITFVVQLTRCVG